MNKQNYTIFALFMAIMIDALGWGVAFPVLDPVILKNAAHMFHHATSLASRNFLYELALSIYCVFMFLMSPVLGSLSDKYGRKIILIISMLGNFLGFLISALSIPLQSYTVLLIGRSIAGATAGSLPIAQAAIMDISSDEQKASRLSLVVVGNVVGFALGPVIGAFFMDQAIFGYLINYQTAFYISSAMGVIGAILLFFFKETYSGDHNVRVSFIDSLVNFGKAFVDKKTFCYCFILLCFLFAWGEIFSSAPVLLTERLGWSGSSVGYFITYVGVLFAVIMLFILPKVTQKFSLVKILGVALASLFACAILFPMIYHSVWPWFVILLATSVPFIYVSIVTMLSMQVGEQHQGEIMGVTGSIFAFTWAVGPMIGGYLLRFGLFAPYVLAAVILLIAILFLGRLRS